jgi:hypothetical protein
LLSSGTYGESLSDVATQLNVDACLKNIVHAFSASPMPSEAYFIDLIPPELRVNSGEGDIPLSSARLYLALRGRFTSDIRDINPDGTLPRCSSTLLRVIARSASTIIDSIAYDNTHQKLVSLWMAAERLMEAAIVWGSYLTILKQTENSSGGILAIGLPTAMNPILQCSTVLASFAGRWKKGGIYMKVWEAYVSLLWGIIEQ